MKLRVGYGEDTHRLVEGRKLIIGGVEIPFELGLLGHSDADVLVHAIIDAVLGACALGDIGQHFPDNDKGYRDISSLILAKRTAELVKEHGFYISNIDATVIAQKPKLAAFRDDMRRNTSYAFGMDIADVSVKFTTPEHTGPEGNLECITSRAVAMVAKDV
ncbi:MAG: 2-C-methyl-D-erythritol 2,4-cyclodiphosphate synthase [Christensenellaceae bacterium]|nr:2-C-methyl-D-erythritol 2,4-cyclodiphosphate synthase [Christensenellaceae bacterium]